MYWRREQTGRGGEWVWRGMKRSHRIIPKIEEGEAEVYGASGYLSWQSRTFSRSYVLLYLQGYSHLDVRRV